MEKNITIFNSWEDITISQYLKIQLLDQTDVNFENDVIKLLTTLTDEDLHLINDVTLNEIKSNLIFLFTPPDVKVIKNISIDGKVYYNSILKNFNINQYITLQPLFGDSINNMNIILSHVLIPSGGSYNDNYDIEELSELILNNINIVDGISILKSVTDFFVNITNKFQNFFGNTEEDDDDDEDTDETPTGNGFEQIWSWMIISEQIILLTHLNINQVWGMTVDDYFTYASYVKDKKQKEADDIQKYKQQ